MRLPTFTSLAILSSIALATSSCPPPTTIKVTSYITLPGSTQTVYVPTSAYSSVSTYTRYPIPPDTTKILTVTYITTTILKSTITACHVTVDPITETFTPPETI